MTNIINTYSGNPYQHLVEMAKLAQKDGVIKGTAELAHHYNYQRTPTHNPNTP